MSPAQRMRGEQCSEAQEIEVLPPNWHGVQVYMRCQQTVLAGMGGGAMMGLSAVETLAAARMLRAPVAEWPDCIDAAQSLASEIAKIENDRAKSRAKSASKKG